VAIEERVIALIRVRHEAVVAGCLTILTRPMGAVVVFARVRVEVT
jgi:hypothetical protein